MMVKDSAIVTEEKDIKFFADKGGQREEIQMEAQVSERHLRTTALQKVTFVGKNKWTLLAIAS